jgi:predicted MFS family arabinose efflux permease
MIGGWLAGAMSYQAMFVLAAVIGAISWALLRFGVREPRKQKTEASPEPKTPG